MSFKVKITGVDALIRKIQQAPEKIAKESEKIINDSVVEIANSARTKVPIGKRNGGTLKNSIGYSFYNGEKGASVFAKAYYAAYVEFGTGDRFYIPNYKNINSAELDAYAATFKRRKKALLGVPHRPFMFNSYSEVLGKMVNKIKKIRI